MTNNEVIKVLIPTIVHNKGSHQQNRYGFSCTGLHCIECPFEEDNTLLCTHNIARFFASINLQNFDQLDINAYKQSNPEWFI